jgi:hypothetical protein
MRDLGTIVYKRACIPPGYPSVRKIALLVFLLQVGHPLHVTVLQHHPSLMMLLSLYPFETFAWILSLRGGSLSSTKEAQHA